MRRLLSVFIIVACFALIACNNMVATQTNNKETVKNQEEKKFKEDLEEMKKTVTSNKKITIADMDKIDQFIDKNADRNEVKNDLCNFIVEKMDEYIKTGNNDENLRDRLETALARLYINYKDNKKVVALRNSIALDKAVKEAGQQKQEQKSQELSKPKNLTSSDGNLELINHGTDNGYIVGTIKNNSSGTYSYVQVNINLYNTSGNQVGSTLANVNNLEGNKSWNFRAVVTEKNVTSYKIMEISAN